VFDYELSGSYVATLDERGMDKTFEVSQAQRSRLGPTNPPPFMLSEANKRAYR
jgi:hypothetical protein